MDLMVKKRITVSMLMTGVLLLLLAIAAWAASPKAEPLPVYWTTPAFSLTDQAGRTMASDDLGGKVWIANFIYTSCNDTCPLLTVRMKQIQERLRTEGWHGKDVMFISFSVDPRRDTAPVLQKYAAQFDADPAVWRFLTGPEWVIRPMIIDGFRLGVTDIGTLQGSDKPDGVGNIVVHSNRFVIVDRQGRVRANLDGMEPDAVDRILVVLRQLMR
jgi:protein SCO1